jgi:phage tail-like protein
LNANGGVQFHSQRQIPVEAIMALDLMNHLGVTPAFRFIVNVDGVTMGVFTECTLPTIEWDVEEIKEGGLNTYIHQLPGRRKSAKITLKNGLGNSKQLLSWYTKNLSEKFSRHRVTITLLNSLLVPMMVLEIQNAYPVRWTGPQLKTDQNTIAIQSLELACGEITVV